MEARLTALENRLRQTERALVVERLARQAAEVTQQTMETWPAGVDAEEIGTLPMFSGDIDLSERTDSVHLVPVEPYNPELLRKVQSDDSWDAAASGYARGRSDHHRQHSDDEERRNGSRHSRTVCLF